MDDNSKNEHGFLDKVSLKDVFVDTVREVVPTLEPGAALMLKYKLVDGLPYEDVVSKYNEDSMEDFESYDDFMENEYPDVRHYTPSEEIAEGYYDYSGEYHELVVDDVIRNAMSTVESSFRDKLFDVWTSEYEKQNGCLPAYCDALKNLDSLSGSGWFDDVSDCDPGVKACIDDALKSHRPHVSRDILDAVKQRCADGNFAMSDHERASCENLLEWCREDLRDDVKRKLTEKAMLEIADSLHDYDPKDKVYLCVFGDDVWRNHISDSAYAAEHEANKESTPLPSELVTDFRDDISANVDFGAIESKIDGLARFPSTCDTRVWDRAKDATASFVSGKPRWSSATEFVADSMLKYTDKDYVASVCDGSYKNTGVGSPEMRFVCEAHDAAYNASRDICDDARRELKDMMAAGGSLDSDKLMSRVLDPGFKSDPNHTPMEDLFAALCDRVSDDFSMGFKSRVLPVYGRNIDFDDIARVSGESDMGNFLGTPDDIKDDIDRVFTKVEDEMADLVSRGAARARFDFDIKVAYYGHDCAKEIDNMQDGLVAALKDRVSKSSPLPDDLKNAVDNLNDDDVDDDKQFDE